MLTIYSDGIELKGARKKFAVSIMGHLNHPCNYCGGSFVKIRRVLIHSDESPVIFFYRCASCGKISRISKEFPAEWYQRINGRIISLTNQPVHGAREYECILLYNGK